MKKKTGTKSLSNAGRSIKTNKTNKTNNSDKTNKTGKTNKTIKTLVSKKKSAFKSDESDSSDSAINSGSNYSPSNSEKFDDNANSLNDENDNADGERKIWKVVPEKSFPEFQNYLNINDETFPLPKDLPQYKYQDCNPYEIFQLFFTDQLLQLFVDSTNNFINNYRKNRDIFINISAPDATNLDFKQDLITLKEIKVYLGIRMLFCINRKHTFLGNNS